MKKEINENWLNKITRTQATSWLFSIASLTLLIIVSINILMFFFNINVLTDAEPLLYILIGLVISGILFKIYSFSKHYKILVLKKTYTAEKNRLSGISNQISHIKYSFDNFVKDMIEKDIKERPSKSEELKLNQVLYMQKTKKEIEELRIKLTKLIKNDFVDYVELLKDLGNLNEMDEENLNQLLESLSLINKEDDSWEKGGRGDYRKRITPLYYEHYNPRFSKKTKWLDDLKNEAIEIIEKIESFAQEKGIAL